MMFLPECIEMCNSTVTNPELFQYPFTAVMDTTQSQKGTSIVIRDTMIGLALKKAKKYQLVEFDDEFGKLDPPDYTKVYDATTDRAIFDAQVDRLQFWRSNEDFPERMFRGNNG